MSHPHAPLSRRERMVRLFGGLALVALGCVIFAYSKSHDAQNRGAIAGILGVIIGLTYFGQGLRGRREAPPRGPTTPAPLPGVSAEQTMLAVILGWGVPGLGHIAIGQRAKGWLYFWVITLLFAAGVFLAEGRNLSYERDHLYFFAYGWNAGATALGWVLTNNLALDHEIPFLQIGFLYSAVAGLLNLVALMDLVGLAARAAPPASQATTSPVASPQAPPAAPPATDAAGNEETVS
ncbi:MAG: DUF6677 family protein [Planctomycetaceae bacterium]